MNTLKKLKIYTDGENRIIKIPEFARYVGLTKDKFENDNFDYAFSKTINSLIFIDDFNDIDKVFCPICGQEVYAKRGSKNKHSFSHYPDESCRGIESDEISEDMLNNIDNSSSSSNHSELPKLQKFRYKISGQGLVNALMQYKMNKENDSLIIVQDSIKPILNMLKEINVDSIDNLDEFINNLNKIMPILNENIDNLEKFLNSRSDEEFVAGGLDPKVITNVALSWGAFNI